MKPVLIDSGGPDQSLELGRRLGVLLHPGDVVALWGELGAGKTLLARGIARGLGVPENVPITSPTFTYINEYDGNCRFYHLDLYRLSHPDELETLPWREALFGSGVAVVEWPDRLGDLIPEDRWDIVIEITGENERRFSVRTFGAVGPELATALRDAPRSPGS